MLSPQQVQSSLQQIGVQPTNPSQPKGPTTSLSDLQSNSPWNKTNASPSKNSTAPSADQPSNSDKGNGGGLINETFGSGNPSGNGIVGGLLRSTIGKEGAGGVIGNPIDTAIITGSGVEKNLAESQGNLANVTTALIKKIQSLPSDDPARQHLIDIVKENQGIMGLDTKQLDELSKATTTPEQQVGTTLNTLATAAGTAAPETLAQKMLVSSGLGAAFGAGQAMNSKEDVGGILRSAGIGAATGAAAQGVMSGISGIAKLATKTLPTTLLRALTGQSTKELVAGKDISQYILDNKIAGKMSTIISNAKSSVSDLSKQIAQKLESLGGEETNIASRDIADQVASKINSAGGQTTADDVMETIGKLAPQAKGLLTNDENTLVDANRMRQLLDQTLGDKGFLNQQLPYNKFVLREFDNTLRNTVKDAAPETKPLFDELSKNITLRDTLLDESARTSRESAKIRWRDLIAAGMGMGAAGIPGAAGALVLERGLGSAPFLTYTAQGLNMLAKAAPTLERLSVPQRLFIMNTLGRTAADSNQTNGESNSTNPEGQ